MTGPERYVLKAAAALILETMAEDTGSSFSFRDGSAAVADVAALSKYHDITDRRLVEELDRKGYAEVWISARGRNSHKRVRLSAKGWMEALNA